LLSSTIHTERVMIQRSVGLGNWKYHFVVVFRVFG
jgi:hypothetical protein